MTVAACRRAGFSPDIVHTTLDWTTVLAFVAAEASVAVVPRLGQTAAPDGVVIRRLDDPPVRHVFATVRRGSEGAPAIRAVLGALAEQPLGGYGVAGSSGGNGAAGRRISSR